ncbi:MAG TPA: ATP-binding protein [Longimicrobium sp.]|jgi:signal transduction histidine kinase
MRLSIDSIRVRLSLWYAALLAVALASMAGATYSLLDRMATRRAARSQMETAATLLATGGRRGEQLEDVVRQFRAPDRRILLFGPRGELRAFSVAPRFGPRVAEEVFAPISAGTILVAVRAAPRRGALVRLRAVDPPVRVTGMRVRRGRGTMLAVVGSTRAERMLREEARAALVLAVLVTLAIAVIPGSLLVRRSLAPIGDMTRRAARIGAARLGDRLAVGNPRDELGSLALVFNELLDRLQGAFEQQRRLMAEAAHELRTPVAVVRAETELALSGERTADEYREALSIVGGEAERLGRIVDDLLTYSRAEAGEYPLRMARIDLGELAADATRSLRSLAAMKGVELAAGSTEELPMEGDADLLRRLVINLVENAVKHGTAGERVGVEAVREEGEYRLRVCDSGPGIPPEVQAKIFEPFFRGSGARAEGGAAGAGLGLPIARWIAVAHGGRLELAESGPGGSVFQASFPAPPAEPPPS